jgi:histidine triad (HIT) family protein
MDCIFCRIVAGEIPADIVFRDDEVIAFRDINPQAPTHILVVPRLHIASLTDAADQRKSLLGRLLLVAKNVAEKENVATNGYRLVLNCGADGGQLVPHIHLHVLGGRRLDDRMG